MFVMSILEKLRKRKGLYEKTYCLGKGSRICEHHFYRQRFVINPAIKQQMPSIFRKCLKSDAVPTIFNADKKGKGLYAKTNCLGKGSFICNH